ncbi:hypothetical protein KIS4809_4691 [Bacillus sp. ZZV12-4809]|jgi:hypothetical protein|nr:hypothetical protein KIS4809_4691 [Bacillus sp. ZZV12-4809]
MAHEAGQQTGPEAGLSPIQAQGYKPNLHSYKTKRKRVFTSKTTFSQYDYYFVSFPIKTKFIQLLDKFSYK